MSLADRLRDGPRLSAAEALRLTRDLALQLDALHASGGAHGAVEADGVELLADGTARLGRAAAEAQGATPRGDLQALGRLLVQTLAAPAGEEPQVEARALAAEGRAAATWLVDPGPGGADRASDAARALARVLGGASFLPPTHRDAPPSSVVPLAPHRVALRMACQGAGVAIVSGLVTALPGDTAAVAAALAGGATLGATLTLAEEAARGRPRRRWAAAAVFGVLSPSVVVLAGVVAWVAAAKGALPAAVAEAFVVAGAGTWHLLEVLGWVTAAFALPAAAFVTGRHRGGAVLRPVVFTGLTTFGGCFCLAVVSASGREWALVFVWPVAMGMTVALFATLGAFGLLLGRSLEHLLLRAAVGDAR